MGKISAQSTLGARDDASYVTVVSSGVNYKQTVTVLLAGYATEAYADAAVAAATVGLWDDRGTFDASGGAYPSSGGSGAAGAILKGDIWTISVAGTLPTGQAVNVGDNVRALTDTPGNTQANWAIGEGNLGYVPLNKASNLSDLANAGTARTNLGLGTMATQGAGAVAITGGTIDGVTIGTSTLSITNNLQLFDGAFQLKDNGDITKVAQFECSTIGTGTTRTFTFPNASGTLALLSDITAGTVTTTGSPASGNLTKFSGAGSITNGDLSGDVTTSGTLAATIANDTVTYAKMQNVSATQRIIGRKTAGSGDPEEVSYAEFMEWVGTSARGDVLYRDATAWNRLAAGTSGYFLKTNGAGADPAWAAASAGSSGFVLVSSGTLGAAATTISFTSLDLNAHSTYMIRFSLKNAGAGLRTVSLFYNGDTTATNYRRQALTSANTTTSSGHANTGQITSIDASETTSGEIRIWAPVSGTRVRSKSWYNFGPFSTAMVDGQISHQWTTTGSNVTQIDLTIDAASAFDIGTHYELWRMT